MAALLEAELGASTQLIEGGGGVFDVVVDGKLAYSKHATGEFPQPQALLESLR